MEGAAVMPPSRSDFGPGPWENEPDRDSWTDEATGYPCLAVRHPRMGHWCGYVGLPDGHPWQRKDYDVMHGFVNWDEDNIDELTWAAERPGGREDDNRAAWWVGFDFAHLGDLLPYDAHRGDQWDTHATYKPLGQTKRAAAKVAAFIARHATEMADA